MILRTNQNRSYKICIIMILRTNQNRGNNFCYTDNAGYWFVGRLGSNTDTYCFLSQLSHASTNGVAKTECLILVTRDLLRTNQIQAAAAVWIN